MQEEVFGCLVEFTDNESRLVEKVKLKLGETYDAPENTHAWKLYYCFTEQSDTAEDESQGIKFSFPVALTIIGGLAFLGWLVYLDHKKKEKEDNRQMRDPFITAIMYGLFAIIVVLFLEAFGILPTGWAKDHWYFFIGIMLVVFLYAFHQKKTLKSLPMEKLEKLVWRHVHRRLKARPHRGDAFGSPMPYTKMVETKGEDPFNKKVISLVRIDRGGGRFVLVSLDPTSGYMLEFVENPHYDIVKKLYGKEAAQQFDIERKLMNKELGIESSDTQEQHHASESEENQ